MVLELHICGPAFGLPSIQAQSLATVVYLSQCLPPSEWQLIPTSDPSGLPIYELPALKFDSTWICGFRGIVTFLRNHSSGKWDLDRDLEEQQRADTTAFSAFLESRAQPLLDLALYVCSENYSGWTRPALAQILQWPRQWTVPHRLRDDAKTRSEHLGLSSLDIEAAEEGDGDTNARGAGNIPKSLIAKPKETVTKLLSKSGQQNQFRLDAVTSDVLEPLCELVEKNGSDSWVFGTDKASSLDCLLLAYLSLMSPPLLPPHRWLQAALTSKYPFLLAWTINFRQECFGGPVDAADVLASSASNTHISHVTLPWHPPAQSSMKNMVLTVLATAFESLPIASEYYPVRFTRIAPGEARTAGGDAGGAATNQRKDYPFLLGGLGLAGSALGAATTIYFREELFGRRKATQRIHNLGRRSMSNQRDFGEAGRMLGLA